MKTYLVASMVVLIVLAHVGLWRSDMASGLKLTFTLINAVAWTIILAPIFLIDRWLETIKRRNKSDHDNLT